MFNTVSECLLRVRPRPIPPVSSVSYGLQIDPFSGFTADTHRLPAGTMLMEAGAGLLRSHVSFEQKCRSAPHSGA